MDMEFTNSEAAGLCRLPVGYDKSRYVFFPGCQLGASDPRYVTESYRILREYYPDTALILGCCGAPADWAGDEPLHGEVVKKLKEDWVALGRPVVVFACPTCRQMFQRHLPEIEGLFIYDLLIKEGVAPVKKGYRETIAVFDPCASREEPGLQRAIRNLVKQGYFSLEPHPYEGKLARCCSWGGQVSIVNPSYAREVVKVRTKSSDLPYIAYCANCRDIFAAAGKPCYHILDVLFDLNDSTRKPPTLTERRNNRIALKRKLLAQYWPEEVMNNLMENIIKLDVSPELKQKLHDEMILETDIEAVVEYCESSGKKIFNPDTGSFFGHLLIGRMTYWVEYRQVDGGFKLLNAYSHRMKIEEA